MTGRDHYSDSVAEPLWSSHHHYSMRLSELPNEIMHDDTSRPHPSRNEFERQGMEQSLAV